MLLVSCGNELVLNPQGPGAVEIARSWWILYWSALVVCLLVFAILFAAIWRRRRSEVDAGQAEARGKAAVLWGGGIIPLLLLIVTTVLILLGMRWLDTRAPDDALTVHITGHMFWWELDYADYGFASANELHIPVGEPVRLELESADVIHSFWVPQLHGKMELVPGRTNELVIQADAPGVYSGFCAEFCGPGHSHMRIMVIAQMPDEFEAWAQGQAEDYSPPDTELAEQGQEVFQRLICSNCHTVRGISEAAVEVGPDLTHLGTRSTLAARTLANTRSQLANWITDPQGIKPGNNMPATPMTGQELDALIEFLGVAE